MPIETEIRPFLNWLPGSLLYWLAAVAALAVAAVAVGWLMAALQKGPVVALGQTWRVLVVGVGDIVQTSPRRIWALGWLVFKESTRRPYILVVFAVFLIILLHAGWFEPADVRDPAQYHLESVLTTTGYLVLLLVLLLSALSLPADIRSKTLHTVVTKPVRSSEVVLGRMLGFAAVGTLLLVVMGGLSYLFVLRLLSHEHELSQADVRTIQQSWDEQLAPGAPAERIQLGTLLPDRPGGHVHELYITRGFAASRVRELREELGSGDRATTEQNLLAKGWQKTEQGWLMAGRLQTEVTQDHWHEFSYSISADQDGEHFESKIEPQSGPAEGMLIARVPIFGRLSFTERDGKPGKGVNVGDEWEYRSFIEGATLATAIWEFEGITAKNFPRDEYPNGLPLEMTIEVFRTYKGETDDPANIPGITGTLDVRNPQTGVTVNARVFEAKEFTTDVQYIPFKLQTSEGRTLDLLEDLAPEGKLEVLLRCAKPAQYFGAARPDVYFRARDASFTLNFAKGCLGIWLQMMLVIGLGVMFSTFLSGPVALLATAGTALAGLVLEFISQLAAGLVPGGGPIEALIRLVTHQNVTSDMQPGLRTTLAKMIDSVLILVLKLVAAVMPAFGQFDFAKYVAYGYDISANLALQSICRGMAFLLPVSLAGYFFLRVREIGK